MTTNESDVDESEARAPGDLYEQITRRCELWNVRASDGTKDMSMPVPGSGYYLNDATRARNISGVYGKERNKSEAMKSSPGEENKCRGWLDVAVTATLST